MADIAIVGGCGYVGLVYSVAFAKLGHTVTSVDVDAARVASLREGRSPIFEPGLDDLLHSALTTGRLSFTSAFHDAIPAAEFVFICVGTPSDALGKADLTYVADAARQIGAHATGHTVIVNKSTMPIGSVEYVSGILAEHASSGSTFDVVSNPEFLREGAALHDVLNPSRIVIGASCQAAADRVAGLYASLSAPILMTDPRTAEMIKYASNAFLATKISFINEVSNICEQLGADSTVVAQGMGLDDRIGARFLQPGVGFGGSCFPKDVRALAAMAREAGLDSSMLSAVLSINQAMRGLVVEKLTQRCGGIGGKTIAILGLAFKPGTDDVREAPALDIIGRLLACGATVRATDPVANHHVASAFPEVSLFDNAYAAAAGADAVVLMTEWDEYRGLDLDHLANAMRGNILLDGRNALNVRTAEDAGLHYIGIGRYGASARAFIFSERPSLSNTLAAD